MQTTVDFLDSIKEKHNLTSDYQLAKFLGIRPNRISRYRHGGGSFDDATCLLIADALKVDPGYVMACVNSERAIQPEVKTAWAHTAELLYGLAAVLVLTVVAPFLPWDSDPSLLAVVGFTASTSDKFVYYVKYRISILSSLFNQLVTPSSSSGWLGCAHYRQRCLPIGWCVPHSPGPK